MNEAYNCVFATPNYSDVGPLLTPTFSGGSWAASLPLTNLQDRRVHKVARSTNALAASTQFDADLKDQRDLRVYALIGHNISRAGQVRIRTSNTAGDFSVPVFDSGLTDVWGEVYPPTVLPWGMPGLWDGKLSAEDAIDYPMPFIDVRSAPEFARYVRVEVVDTANPDGYVEIGRLVVAAGYQPSVNMNYGARHGWETATVRTETDGGAAVYNEKPRRKVTSFGFDVPQDEAVVLLFEYLRRLGTSGQLFFVFDPTDTYHMHRRAYLCVFKELGPLEYPNALNNAAGFSLIEEL